MRQDPPPPTPESVASAKAWRASQQIGEIARYRAHLDEQSWEMLSPADQQDYVREATMFYLRTARFGEDAKRRGKAEELAEAIFVQSLKVSREEHDGRITLQHEIAAWTRSRDAERQVLLGEVPITPPPAELDDPCWIVRDDETGFTSILCPRHGQQMRAIWEADGVRWPPSWSRQAVTSRRDYTVTIRKVPQLEAARQHFVCAQCAGADTVAACEALLDGGAR